MIVEELRIKLVFIGIEIISCLLPKTCCCRVVVVFSFTSLKLAIHKIAIQDEGILAHCLRELQPAAVSCCCAMVNTTEVSAKLSEAGRHTQEQFQLHWRTNKFFFPARQVPVTIHQHSDATGGHGDDN